MRKFSTGEESMDGEDHFKNKTLRFTNNNFVANSKQQSMMKESKTSNLDGGWDSDENNKKRNKSYNPFNN